MLSMNSSHPEMNMNSITLPALLLLPLQLASAQGTAPTFQYTAGPNSYTLAGRPPARQETSHRAAAPRSTTGC